MNITNYSREQIQQFIKDGICSVDTLRHYEVLKELEKVGNVTHVATDNNLSRSTVIRIRNKYMLGKV